MRVRLNYLNEAILRDIANVAMKLADSGVARVPLEDHDYADADTLTWVLHDIRNQLGEIDVDQGSKEGK